MPVDLPLRIENHEDLGASHFLLTLASEETLPEWHAGQFAMISIGQPPDSIDPLLRRPFSIYNLPTGSSARRSIQIFYKVLGLGSALNMLKMRYGESDSLEFTEAVSRELAVCGWQEALALAKEKGPAPIMNESFQVTQEMLLARPEMVADGYKAGDRVPGRVLHARYSRYMQQLSQEKPELIEALAEQGARFTHHSSIAPTGTIALSVANNASSGIEPSFGHHYVRNVIREGKKTKDRVDVYSYELLAYRSLIDDKANPEEPVTDGLPDYFVTTTDISPKQHVDVQAAAQKWVDSSISKTANVASDYPFEQFKDIYLYACEKQLKGCTTFRFNPERFQGVMVSAQNLRDTTYRFTLGNGEVVELRGDEEVEYEGEVHSAANLYDALKEGYYGKL